MAKELEMRGADVAGRLKMSKSTVGRVVVRGEKIPNDMGLKLIEN